MTLAAEKYANCWRIESQQVCETLHWHILYLSCICSYIVACVCKWRRLFRQEILIMRIMLLFPQPRWHVVWSSCHWSDLGSAGSGLVRWAASFRPPEWMAPGAIQRHRLAVVRHGNGVRMDELLWPGSMKQRCKEHVFSKRPIVLFCLSFLPNSKFVHATVACQMSKGPERTKGKHGGRSSVRAASVTSPAKVQNCTRGEATFVPVASHEL